jgi:hypothetical protein
MFFVLAQSGPRLVLSMIAAVLAAPSTWYQAKRRELKMLMHSGYWVLRYWVLLARHNADVGQVAVAFGIVQAVADDEFIRDREADIVAL